MAGIKRGRARKSVEQLKLEGKYRADRHGPESHSIGGTPVKPDYLDGIAGELWDTITPRLIETGIASDLDSQTLAAMCEFYAAYREAATEKTDRESSLDRVAEAINNLAAAVEVVGGCPEVLEVCERVTSEIGYLVTAVVAQSRKSRFANMKAAYQQFALIAARFGLTPTDRRAMRDVSVEKADDDPFAAFLKRRSAAS